MTSDMPVAVILAGGRSNRFGGEPKALISLNGKPLIEHVIVRLAPQVSRVALSVDQYDATLEYLGLEQIEDPKPGAQGPLPALLSALRWLKNQRESEWLQITPCDTPFLPGDLSQRLIRAAVSERKPGAVPADSRGLQPACALWHEDILNPVEQAVARGMRGFKEFLRDCPVPTLGWPRQSGTNKPFFNINTPEDLQLAGESLASAQSLPRHEPEV